LVLAQRPLGVVAIAVDDEAVLAGVGHEEQHVATGQGGDQGFLWIDRRLVRQGRRQQGRRRGRTAHHGPAVEAPVMAATVFVVAERLLASAPFDRRPMYAPGRSS